MHCRPRIFHHLISGQRNSWLMERSSGKMRMKKRRSPSKTKQRQTKQTKKPIPMARPNLLWGSHGGEHVESSLGERHCHGQSHAAVSACDIGDFRGTCVCHFETVVLVCVMSGRGGGGVLCELVETFSTALFVHSFVDTGLCLFKPA